MHKRTLLSALLICALGFPAFAQDAADFAPRSQQTMERSKQQIELEELLNPISPSELQAKRLYMEGIWKQVREAVNSPTMIEYTKRPDRFIPDNTPVGITDTIAIPATNVGFIAVRIDTLTHTWVSDLRFVLFGPLGDSCVLMNRRGGSGDNMRRTVFTDTATRLISSVVAADSPFTGFFRPESALARFQRAQPTGNWILKVSDNAAADTGRLIRWTIIIETSDVTGPSITHTALTNTTSTAARVASATITDASGVQRSTAGAPRLYHRTGTSGAFTAITADSVRTNIWYFSIPGRTAGSTVQYYIAAQDSANNPSTLPSGGSGINPPGSTAPTTLLSYLVLTPVNILYSNGPLSTGPRTRSGVLAPAGFEWSEVQPSDTANSNTVAGFSAGITTTTRFRLADNFTVPAGQQWRIDSIFTWAYQTGNTGVTSPFISANVRIWNGMPDTLGSTVVFGDTTTNRLGASINSSLYRVFCTTVPPPGTPPGTTRVIWQNTILVGTTLGPGNYWLDWQTQITASAAHFAPSVTIPNRRGLAGWNGRQRIGTTPSGWTDLIDAGNPAAAPDSAQDMPFQLIGANVAPTPGWTAQTSGLTTTLYSIRAINQNIAWTAGAGGRVLRTTNGGNTWTSVGGGRIGTNDIYAIEARNADTAFVTTSPAAGTYIYRTTNGGASWDSVFFQAGGFVNAIKMFTATSGIAVGDPVGTTWTILRTTNAGASWARTTTEPAVVGGEFGANNGLAFFAPGTLWMTPGSATNRIYRSTDQGTTWVSSTLPFNGFAAGVWFNTATLGAVGSNAGSVARSTDGGATWGAVTIPGTGAVHGIAGNNAREFYATRGSTVYKSVDQALTWTQSYAGGIGALLEHLSMVVVNPNIYGWAVSNTGGIAAYFGIATGVRDESAGIPETFALDQNYPNPFNPSTTIRFALPEAANVNLSVYNVLGQRVATLTNQAHAAGVYNATWNGRNEAGAQVASGLYFFRIEAKATNGGATFTSIKKAMLMK